MGSRLHDLEAELAELERTDPKAAKAAADLERVKREIVAGLPETVRDLRDRIMSVGGAWEIVGPDAQTNAVMTRAALAARPLCDAWLFEHGRSERVEAELVQIWRGLRNDASAGAVGNATACIDFAHRAGLLSDDRHELWQRRIVTCPGHADEGGRDWCAYCGERPDRA